MHLSTLLFGSLGLALCAASCEPVLQAERPSPPLPAVTPALYPNLAAPVATPSGAPWSSKAPSSIVPQLEGSPVTLAPGARCTAYRRLPSVHYTASTLIRDACIDLPSDTTVTVREGATLAIVATNGLRIGRNVTFIGRGAGGLRGDRAEFASVSFDPGTDTMMRATCVDRGNQCQCPTDESSLARIRGHSGHDGSAGGSVSLVAGALISPTQLSGFRIDVSGGAGGPAGDSGVEECRRGALRCLSPACSTGVRAGATGANGQVFFSLGGTNVQLAMDRMKAATVPAGVTRTVAADGATTLADGSALVDQAVREGWERRSGADEY